MAVEVLLVNVRSVTALSIFSIRQTTHYVTGTWKKAVMIDMDTQTLQVSFVNCVMLFIFYLYDNIIIKIQLLRGEKTW